jgi:hypothetical protein
VSVVMGGGAPRPFIGARGGRGSGWVEGARSAPLMAVGGHFRRGAGSHGWGLNGGGGGHFWERRGRPRGGSAHASRRRWHCG